MSNENPKMKITPIIYLFIYIFILQCIFFSFASLFYFLPFPSPKFIFRVLVWNLHTHNLKCSSK
jgi:hypothetical protein